MIFWTWRSYFIRWQIFENKVWCPVSKKRTKYFHFLLSLAYPIDRLDWALFSVVILFHHLFPLLEKVEIRVFILPRNFPAVLIIFTGRGGAGNPPLPTARGGAGNPPFPAGRVPRGTGRPSLSSSLLSSSPLIFFIPHYDNQHWKGNLRNDKIENVTEKVAISQVVVRVWSISGANKLLSQPPSLLLHMCSLPTH